MNDADRLCRNPDLVDLSLLKLAWLSALSGRSYLRRKTDLPQVGGRSVAVSGSPESDVGYILSAGRGDVKYQPISLRPNNERLHGPPPDRPARRPLCARDETLAG